MKKWYGRRGVVVAVWLPPSRLLCKACRVGSIFHSRAYSDNRGSRVADRGSKSKIDEAISRDRGVFDVTGKSNEPSAIIINSSEMGQDHYLNITISNLSQATLNPCSFFGLK